MLSTSPASFRTHYQALVSSGAIEPDAAQAEVAEAFFDLERRLAGYKPVRKQGLLGRLFADKDREFTPEDLSTIAGPDIRASRVFELAAAQNST